MTNKRSVAVWAVVAAAGLMFLLFFGRQAGGPVLAGEWSYSQLLHQVESGGVSQVRFDPDAARLLVALADQPRPALPPAASASSASAPDALAFDPLQAAPYLVPGETGRPTPSWPPRNNVVWTVNLPSGVPSADLLARLDRAHVDFGVLTASTSNWSWVMALLPVVVGLASLAILGLMIWSMRRTQQQVQAPQRGIQRTFKQINPAQNTTRLSDLAGLDEVKEEAAEFIAFLKDPEHYRRVNAKMTRGVLLVGPPGTGKTMLARAIAGEAGVPFFAVSGSEFVEMFVGVGASRVRELFAQAKAHAPAIIFIDELDGVGRSRGGSSGNSNDEREQTLNQLLVEMDGFTVGQDIIVMAATNRPDVLDKALMRPGRFDRQVQVGLPDRLGRLQILQAHTRRHPLATDVNLDATARGTPGFSGAELANVVNEAALLAGRAKAGLITQAFFNEARDKVMMGAAQKTGIKNERERTVVAYHEAGHAIVARFDPLADPVHKITIVPRGRSLGLTAFLPDEESFNHSDAMLQSNLRGLMGGRAAEEVALNTRTVGASNDFHRATQLARRMVGSWGMDPEMGTISFDGEEGAGNTFGQVPLWSEQWLTRMNDRVVATVGRAYQQAVDTLNDQRALLEAVAQALLQDETLDDVAFEALVQVHGTQVPPRAVGEATEVVIEKTP